MNLGELVLLVLVLGLIFVMMGVVAKAVVVEAAVSPGVQFLGLIKVVFFFGAETSAMSSLLAQTNAQILRSQRCHSHCGPSRSTASVTALWSWALPSTAARREALRHRFHRSRRHHVNRNSI